MSVLDRALNWGEGKQYKSYQQRVARINAFEPELELDTDAELRERVDELRERARRGAPLDELLPECFAVVREAARRTLGMRHFDVQMIGGMVLHDGAIAEMKTGEGKTLTATLAVVLNSLAVRDPDSGERKGVHLITVNDYLARRDAEWMSPIYNALGVSVGVLQSMQPGDEKAAAYACDVVYGTNSEFGFDYLRDNMATDRSQQVQRGHPYAIVDEVDNILIDEARTPLIISGAPEQAAELYQRFAQLARQMVAGKRPEGLDPRAKKEYVADFDYEFDEKFKTVSPTERGVTRAERFLGIDHLYRAENGHLVNHLQQALKAESLYQRDVDYAVIDGEVKIVDEFTGRILEGRRWSEGLHQAVEAKEGVPVQEENQTLATITLQNYFRLYGKLAGMTGTAATEATEFMKIYELPVVSIPTNVPMVRGDRNDQVFKTREGKWSAVVREIVERHEHDQPVLVGTISVEVSELLSRQLSQRGIAHTVLNAKPEHAEREGETIAEAGRPGAVTIATNMAGRGVDIKLGGNAEHLTRLELAKLGIKSDDEDYAPRFADVLPSIEARVESDRERVLEAGGLFICGTERHESRRIDNQLRGRAGRQGDPGESRFFLSAQDDLVRLFAGDRIYKILDRLGTLDQDGNEEPIEAGMLSKQIEKAQKRVEEQNYLQRKHTLDYDDVLNEQRRVIYAYRDQVLEGKDLGDVAREEVAGVLERMADDYTPGDYMEDWDIGGLLDAVGQLLGESAIEDIALDAVDRMLLADLIKERALARYNERERELGEIQIGPEEADLQPLMRQLERFLLLQIIDERWREHLHDVDYLRSGIGLRGFAQIDPLVAYKNEAFTLFRELMNSIWSDFTRLIFHVQVTVEAPPGAPQPVPFAASGSSTRPGRVSYSGGGPMGAAALAAAAASAAAGAGGELADQLPMNGVADEYGDGASLQVEQRRVDEHDQLGRNEPCWCGSGKKFKKCHGA